MERLCKQLLWRSHKKTTSTTDRTTTFLGVEDTQQHNDLSPRHQHLFHIDLTNADASGIRATKDAHKTPQLQPKLSTTTQMSQQKELIISFLPCSFPASAENNPTNTDDCEHKNDRNTQSRVTREASSNDNNNNEDELMSLRKNELVDTWKSYGLCYSGNKTDLTNRITLHLQLLTNVAVEEEDLEVNENM